MNNNQNAAQRIKSANRQNATATWTRRPRNLIHSKTTQFNGHSGSSPKRNGTTDRDTQTILTERTSITCCLRTNVMEELR
jgi:hypothetical protein